MMAAVPAPAAVHNGGGPLFLASEVR
jgi:hypothetical protein